MRGPLAASALATVCIVLFGAAIFGPRRAQDVQIYPQTKLPSPAQLPRAPAHMHWDNPDGWQDEAAQAPAFAMISAPLADGERAICSFTLVANGPEMVQGNISRWLRQLGLGPQAPVNDLGTIESDIGALQMMQLVNPEQAQRAFLVAICSFSDRLLTVKLVAPVADLDALQAPFTQVLQSLRGDDGQH